MPCITSIVIAKMNSTNVSNSDDDGNKHEPLHQKMRAEHDTTEPQRFPTRIRKWLVKFVTDRDEGEDSASRQRRKRRLTILSFLAIALAAYLRSPRRQKHRIASSSSSSALPTTGTLWPISLLFAWWKGPEYRQSPQQSTMYLLYSAAKEGVIQQALIGSNVIFFQTKQQRLSGETSSKEMRWNRTVLPPNNESIKSGLLEALASGGCQDVQAIPESVGSRLATPILAALPFVYLALLYRMMKSQFGGDDISSKLTNGTRKIWGEEASDRTTFDDVAGLPSAVEDMSEVVSYLSNPSLYTAMGARPPRGVLLHGPPGSGSKWSFDHRVCPFSF